MVVMASSGAEEMPKDKRRISVPEGLDVPLCWCQDPCRLMKSEDYSYTYGRRFFMCVNYETDPVKVGPYDRRPPSPSPLCAYMKWVDEVQSEAHEKEVMREMLWRRDMSERHMYKAEQEQKRKSEMLRRQDQKKEEERRAADAREAERARKRELARQSKEQGEEAHASRMRKGKYPKFP